MRNKFYNYLFLVIAFAAISKESKAQLYNSGQMFIDSTAVLYSADTFHNTTSAITINKGTVSAAGTLINNALISGSGKVVLSSPTAQTVSGTGTLSNLEVNSAGASIVTGSMQGVLGTLTITAGNLNANSGLTLLSTDSNTARVAPVTAGTVSGNVFVQRYIPARRAWRLITAPVSNSNTIRAAWQNDGVFTPGVGTFITGPSGSNGLDNGAAASLKDYDINSQQLKNVSSTNVSLSGNSGAADNRGYFLFVRGDRNPANLTPPNSNVTTLTSTGSLQIGTQTFAAAATAGNFTLIGNPYASPVSFDEVGRSNVAKRFYAWDPALNIVGGYVIVDDIDEDGNYSITPTSKQTSILQSSQAIFIQTINNAPAAITFNESSKSEIITNAGFRTNNGTSEILRTNLYLKNAGNTILADGVLAEYNNLFAAAVNIQDGVKMTNLNENLAVERDNQSLSIERRPLVDVNDTMFLKLWNTSTRDYQFEFLPSEFSSVVEARFIDTYLNTSTPLSLTAPTTVDFSITSDVASANARRFYVVFKTISTLPVTFLNLKAFHQEAGIQVDWNVANESNISHYEVEKSANGRSFEKMATVIAKANNNASFSYNSFDANPLVGNNYYRIKSVSKTGGFEYSKIVAVNNDKTKESIVIYPNPVRDNTFNVQFNNKAKGVYLIQLFNAAGQEFYSRTLNYMGGSYTETINVKSSLPKGVYNLKITNGEVQNIQKVIFE